MSLTKPSPGAFASIAAALVAVSALQVSVASAAGFEYHHVVKGLVAPVVAAPALPPPASDPFWANTVLAINAEGGLIDATGINQITVAGSAAAVTTQRKFGESSVYVNNGTSYLTVPAAVMAGTLSSPSWTIECFFYPTRLTGEQFIVSQGTYGSNHQLGLILDSGTSFLIASSSGNWRVNVPAVGVNTWNHVALVMSNGTVSLFLNGVPQGATTKTYPISWSNLVTIGTSTFNNPAYAPFSGYIDDLRITKVARYSTGFAVPTETFPTR